MSVEKLFSHIPELLRKVDIVVVRICESLDLIPQAVDLGMAVISYFVKHLLPPLLYMALTLPTRNIPKRIEI